MEKVCTVCREAFVISAKEESYCKDHEIPLPTICPIDRSRQLAGFLSSHYLYESKCAFTGKPLLTFVPPDTGYKVYDVDIWMSDQWDPLSFGQEYDFSRSFFDQFEELQRKVPFPSLECLRSTMENSDYTNGVGNVKNCYLVFGALGPEDCYFSYYLVDCKDVVDCVYAIKSELCYGCVYINNCYNCRFLENCSNCSDSSLLYNCHGLKNCFGCTNLSNKEFCFYNEQLTKDEYQKKVATIDLGNFSVLQKEKEKFNKLKEKAPLRFFQGNHNENSTGNYLNHTKNCHNCFFSSDCEDIEWGSGLANKASDCLFINGFGSNATQVYYSAAVGENAYNIKFCLDCFSNVRDLEYCMFTGYGSENCFGCTGLRKKQYCILNKQYSKDEYFALVKKIKAKMLQDGEYGQFFPQKMSHMFYNQSWAQDLFPWSKTEAQSAGYPWHEDNAKVCQSTYTVPDHIKDVKDDVLATFLCCEVSNRQYRLLKQELDIYRRFKVPIPRKAPMQRIDEMAKLFVINSVRTIRCSNCDKEIESVYTPTRDQPILCESCYQKVTI